MGVSVSERPDVLRGSRKSGTAAPPAVPGPAYKSTVRPYIPYLLFALCAAIYLLPFMRIMWMASDEGTLVSGAVRVVHGQVFARDFFEVMGPGTFYWLAAFFKLFGVNVLTERFCLFVTSMGTGLAMYFLSRRVCGSYKILPPVLLVSVYFATIWPTVNHHVDSNFFGLLSVVCMVLWQDTRKTSLLLAAGVLAAITTCILQPKGMLLLFAILLWLFIQHRRRAASRSPLGVVLASYCAAIAIFALYFWSQGALRDLIYMNFIWPSQHYGALNAVPYGRGILQFWTQWIYPIHGVRWLLPLAVVLIIPFLLIATLPLLVPVLGIPHRNDNLRPEILLYWFCGWALWLSEIHRRDMAHLVVGSPLLIVLCVHFLAKYRGKAADLALQLLAISAATLAVINLFLVLTARPLHTRAGTMATLKPDGVVTFLDKHTTPGEEIFTYPYCPIYYFLSATTNPTRYSLLVYNYNTPSQFQDAIRILDQRKVKYVVWDTTFKTKAAPFFSAAMYRPAGGLLMEPYLKSHYRVVKDADGILIMERKTENHEN